MVRGNEDLGERQVDEELTWKVRHAKACFYWKRDGRLVRSAQFTQSELEVEIERLSAAGKDITQLALALKKLALPRDR
jgi:hypothetical protein